MEVDQFKNEVNQMVKILIIRHKWLNLNLPNKR